MLPWLRLEPCPGRLFSWDSSGLRVNLLLVCSCRVLGGSLPLRGCTGVSLAPHRAMEADTGELHGALSVLGGSALCSEIPSAWRRASKAIRVMLCQPHAPPALLRRGGFWGLFPVSANQPFAWSGWALLCRTL